MKRGFRLVVMFTLTMCKHNATGLLQYLEGRPDDRCFFRSKYPSRGTESHLQVSNLRISYLMAVL